MVIIEKSIPIPPRKTCEQTSWPFKDMQVGDSVFFELHADKEKMRKTRQIAYSHGYNGKKNKRFISRQEGTGIRIWRVA